MISLSLAQRRFCVSAPRNPKSQKDARPFLFPVGAVAMNIPHYPEIVIHPIDFSTIEHKLDFSSPVKPGPNPGNPRYHRPIHHRHAASIHRLYQVQRPGPCDFTDGEASEGVILFPFSSYNWQNPNNTGMSHSTWTNKNRTCLPL